MTTANAEIDTSELSLNVDDRVFVFQRLDITFVDRGLTDIFAHKNNKTVAETLHHRRYQALSSLVLERYAASLGQPLGTFLLELKGAGDLTYKRFLNPYGDGIYCKFAILPGPLASTKGLYCFSVGGKLVYIGRSRDPFRKRINQGYGTIHPKNCYLDGQATNCHLNALIAAELRTVSCYACSLTEDQDIEHFERRLIETMRPNWNIAFK